MGYKQKNRKTDLTGKHAIPQYFNDTIDDYEPQKGEKGASYTIINALSEDGQTRIPLKVNADGELVTSSKLSGSKVAQQKTEADAVSGVVTFSKNIGHIGIFNTSGTNGVFNVNGIDIHVPANQSFSDPIGGTARATVNITGATSYILTRYE